METRDIVYIALFAAIVAALALFPPITVPLISVPITAQSLGVMLAGGVLGAKRGSLALVLFLALVALGLPLLSGGRGGMGVFFGPTAGFLFGWVVAAFVIGWLTERFWDRLGLINAFLIAFTGGVVVLYAIGLLWVAESAKITLLQAATGSLAYIPGDILKAAIAAFVMVTVKRSYPLIRPANTASTAA